MKKQVSGSIQAAGVRGEKIALPAFMELADAVKSSEAFHVSLASAK